MHLPLTLKLNRSLRLVSLLVSLHIAALACLAPLAIPLFGKLTGAMLLLFSFGAALQRHVLMRAPATIVALTLRGDGVLEYHRRDGTSACAKVLPDSSAFVFLIVLLLETEETRKRRALVILPDALPPEALRQLRIWLRWWGNDAA